MYSPRTFTYFLALEFSEVLSHVEVPDPERERLDRCAATAWRLVQRLDRLASARTARGVPAARGLLGELYGELEALSLKPATRELAMDKLQAIDLALFTARDDRVTVH